MSDGRRTPGPWAVHRLTGHIEVNGFVSAFWLLNVMTVGQQGQTSKLQIFKLAKLDQSVRRDKDVNAYEIYDVFTQVSSKELQQDSKMSCIDTRLKKCD